MAKTNKRTPINRNNRFFSENDFELEIQMGREHIEEDLNFVVVLYRVNHQKTQKDDVYHESVKDGIKYDPPMELRVVPVINEPNNMAYNPNNTGRHIEDGNLTFGIYQKQLEEKNTDIKYGDYIGYAIDESNMEYFSVVNDGAKFHDNEHTILGYKGAFRTIVCSPINDSEFRGV